jgi:Mn-dependent DtxR family transcriptional regulator
VAAEGTNAISQVEPSMRLKYTERQGQYLAFIYYYTKLHGYAPAEADMQRYFKVSPPAAHDMILMLEKRGLIERSPRQSRSIRVLLPPQELPNLE